MGFSAAQAKKALRETVSYDTRIKKKKCSVNSFRLQQNNDTERALDWLFSHPDDNGEETVQSNVSAEAPVVGSATGPFNYNLDSFVSHKGTSVHCGHYVSHVRKNGEWILFNDNKVAVTPNPPIGEAYLYFLERQ